MSEVDIYKGIAEKEVKEILERIKKHYVLDEAQDNLLLDYITNLQQELEEYKDTETYSKRFLYKANKDRLNANLDLVKENEKLKEHKEYYKNETKRLGKLFYITKEENIKLEEAQKNFEKQFIKEMNYKSRIEKAIEYIESINIFGVRSGKTIFIKILNNLLNILRGNDNE